MSEDKNHDPDMVSAEATEINKEAAELIVPEAEVEIHFIDDRDTQADGYIQWGAARAGVIVAAPVLGTAALIANEVYMIAKIGTVYGVELSHKAILSFLGSLGATVVGSTLATLIPLSFMQIPIGISVTYGVGKAARRWIKDGMPDDTTAYKAVFEEERKEGAKKADTLEDNPQKDIPLGDEKRDYTEELKKAMREVYPGKAHEAFDKAAEQLEQTVNVLGDKLVGVLKKAGLTDEQIEKAKYTAVGAGEVAQETAEKTIRDTRVAARIKSRELREEAIRQADVMRARARLQMEEMREKSRELKDLAERHAEKARLHSEILRAEAKDRAEEWKDRAKEHADFAKEKAEELKEKIKAAAGEYKEAAAGVVNEAKENILNAADDFRIKTEERATLRREEAKKNKTTILQDINVVTSSKAEDSQDNQ